MSNISYNHKCRRLDRAALAQKCKAAKRRSEFATDLLFQTAMFLPGALVFVYVLFGQG